MRVEDRIIKALEGGELSMTELVSKVQAGSSSVKSTAVKAAVLPLISSDQVSLTAKRKLSLREAK